MEYGSHPNSSQETRVCSVLTVVVHITAT